MGCLGLIAARRPRADETLSPAILLFSHLGKLDAFAVPPLLPVRLLLGRPVKLDASGLSSRSWFFQSTAPSNILSITLCPLGSDSVLVHTFYYDAPSGSSAMYHNPM